MLAGEISIAIILVSLWTAVLITVNVVILLHNLSELFLTVNPFII